MTYKTFSELLAFMTFSLIFLQIKRIPKSFPKLNIKRQVTCIDDFKYEDFEIVGYECHPPLKMKMAV